MHWLTPILKPLAAILAALSPGCRQASRLQSLALDSRLTLSQRLGLRIHLVLCRWCRRYGTHIRFLHDAARDHAEDLAAPAPQPLPEAVRERLKQRLRAGKDADPM